MGTSSSDTSKEWYFTAHWRELSSEYLCEVENRCKDSRYSSAEMLGHDESLIEMLERDEQTLLKLGITHKQIGDVLQNVENAGGEWREIFNGRYLANSVSRLGSQKISISTSS